MMRHWVSCPFVLLVLATALPAGAADPAPARKASLVHHALTVTLLPGENRMIASDRITLPEHRGEVRFTLHAGLNPVARTAGVRITGEGPKKGPVPMQSYRVQLPPQLRTFVISYGGVIHHPIAPIGREQARGFNSTPGMISEDGVYLAASSGWYPQVDEGFIAFSLEIELPAGWDAVSQGDRTGQDVRAGATVTVWNSPEPQDEIYLVAGRFTEFLKPAGDTLAMAFLREPDSALAGKYLDATAGYLALYGKLIGPYPYRKFALVENFWETGFGMPSFTLLGPTIIRLPFIINSSYPHEILHNWWGNGVFPDYEKGNWSEGLTAYLADHLIREQQGGGPEYRVATLQKYADYVIEGRDLPLSSFTSRHSSATEAVGYGKSQMFFHMLRRELGDGAFSAGLRHFYRSNKFKIASYDDLRRSFERASGRSLKQTFDQWVHRTGAPELALVSARSLRRHGAYSAAILLRQEQSGRPYRMLVPVAVTIEGRAQAFQTVVEMTGKEQNITLEVPGRPLRVDLDPEFDLFRRLAREEIPPALTQALGARKMLVVLPSSAEAGLLQAYGEFGRSLAGSGPEDVTVKMDSEVDELPEDRTVAVLGWENRFLAPSLSALAGYPFAATQKRIRIGRTDLPRAGHAVVLTARNRKNPDAAVLVVAADRAAALPGLGRKLPHYHKYSYLVFDGDGPENVAKGRWPVLSSPLTAFLPGKRGRSIPVEMGALEVREPLAALASLFSKERMFETVKHLSDERLRGRGTGTPEIDRAAEYIAQQFREAGLAPGGSPEGSYYQEWTDPGMKLTMRNVLAVIPGRNPAYAGQSVVIGAHYDHLGTGRVSARREDRDAVHPGADDNASGVAVLLELARVLKEGLEPERSIVFVAFTGEEAGRLGSKHYAAAALPWPASKAVGMVNLDTVGRLGKNKLLVLGAGTAKEWPHLFRAAGFAAHVEIELVAEDLDASDQKSFHHAGVPAVQLFTGPHLDYHRPTDTADRINADGLVKVAAVANEIIEQLAKRPEPLTAVIGKAAPPAQPKQERAVSLGAVPDFAFKGRGVRLSGVAPGSPAEQAGLREGDVIVGISAAPVDGLKDLSDALRSKKPGDRVRITFVRNGSERNADAVLHER